MDEEYVSLEEALTELGISESELRAMVTRGQLQVFEEAGEERFLRSAIDNLKKSGETQPTIILPGEEEPLPIIGEEEPLPIAGEEPSAPAEEPETVFAEDDSPTEMPLLAEEDEAAPSDGVMPTIELSPDETGVANVDEEHTDVATQEVSLAEEDYLILEEDKVPTSAMEAPGEFAAAEAPAEEPEEEPVEYETVAAPHGLQTFLLGVLTVFMLVSLIVFAGAVNDYLPAGLRDWLLKTGASVGLANEDDL